MRIKSLKNLEWAGKNKICILLLVGPDLYFRKLCHHDLFRGDVITKKYHKAEYVQCRVCFVNVKTFLQENVVFSVCARMGNATYIIFIMWTSISGLDT